MIYIIGIKGIETAGLKIIRNLRNRPEYIEELLGAIVIEHILHVEIVNFQVNLVLRQILPLEHVHVEHFVTCFVGVLVQPYDLQLKLFRLSIVKHCKLMI